MLQSAALTAGTIQLKGITIRFKGISERQAFKYLMTTNGVKREAQ